MRTAALLMAALLLAGPALADGRETRIAMAMALLDVAADRCEGRLHVDPRVRARLYENFHEYDIAGLASLLSRPLNDFYEDFSYRAEQGLAAFCREAPATAARTGYPVLLAGGG